MRVNATLIGLTSIIFWSTMVGMIRIVSTDFGALGGAALLYTFCALFLLPIMGIPKIQKFPKKYLFFCGLLFVSYELCLSLSIGYAHSSRQAIEVSLVNYLWPSLTVLLASLISGKKYSHWITFGIILALYGLYLVIGGDHELNLMNITYNIKDNPLSYTLALCGAIIWAVYSVTTPKIAKGQNGVVVFFVLTALTLWIKFFTEDSTPLNLDFSNTLNVVLASIFLSLGYASWNHGILHGNASTMASASYITPVLSSALASFNLATKLPLTFWYGTCLICAGSIACIYVSRNHPKSNR